ncbi:hypothetical protein IKF15_02040, partial [Candidatus Saccharibacteria bacterium]|nr:hypothetical protein [Candidatus Saccharibacteria bacterium]
EIIEKAKQDEAKAAAAAKLQSEKLNPNSSLSKAEQRRHQKAEKAEAKKLAKEAKKQAKELKRQSKLSPKQTKASQANVNQPTNLSQQTTSTAQANATNQSNTQAQPRRSVLAKLFGGKRKWVTVGLCVAAVVGIGIYGFLNTRRYECVEGETGYDCTANDAIDDADSKTILEEYSLISFRAMEASQLLREGNTQESQQYFDDIIKSTHDTTLLSIVHLSRSQSYFEYDNRHYKDQILSDAHDAFSLHPSLDSASWCVEVFRHYGESYEVEQCIEFVSQHDTEELGAYNQTPSDDAEGF